jgi:hypothetical protein
MNYPQSIGMKELATSRLNRLIQYGKSAESKSRPRQNALGERLAIVRDRYRACGDHRRIAVRQ